MRHSLLYVNLAILLVVLAAPAQAFAQDMPVSALGRAPVQLQTLSPVMNADQALADVGKNGSTVTREINGQTYMSLWLEGKASEADLKSLGVIIGTRFPNGVMTADVPLAMYKEVAALPGMTRITAVHMARPCLNYSTPTTQAKPNYWTSSPPNFSGQAGAGVIVGDVNNGIDYKHLDFKNPDGTSRILFLWDQIDATTPHPANPAYTYGREFSTADLNANLATVRDGADGHGSHCMGIAAGDGSATGNGQPGDVFIGMAPRADMVIVVTDYTDAHIADGVHYIFQKAALAGKNAVVNLSLGSAWGAHLGTETFDTSINSLTGAGNIVVASAGNDGGIGMHALRMVPSGTQTVTFSIPSYTTNAGTNNDFVQIDAYYDATASMKVAITSPRGTSNVAAVSKGGTGGASGTGATDGTVYVENGYTPSPSGLQNIFIQIYDASNARPPRLGTWTITLTWVSGTNPQLDLWLPSEQLGALGVLPAFVSGLDEHDTVGSPASAPNVIAVGAITDKNRWLSINGSTYVFLDTTAVGALTHWSSVGPLRDGTHKPEMSTFGGGVMSTLSSAVTRNATNNVYIHPDGQHQIMSGTSMAAPHVAGGVALILADTPGLTPAQVKTRLANDALVDGQTGSVWNYQYGNGKLRMLRPDTTPPTVTVNSPNGGENWAFASSHNITWTATDNVGVTSIDIAYSTNNGGSYTPIATGEANDGVYAWTVPSIATTQALVKVTAHDAATNTAFDVSNAVFTISDQTAPTVTVNAPNGGENWIVGTSHNVTWTATDNVGVTSISIDYSINNGGNWTSVATGEANDGTYAWTIPNAPSTQALVKVTAYDAATNSGSDVSNAVFTISAVTHTIVASAGTGGTINPSGNVVVNDGADQGFTIAANPCYDILDVAVDGVPQGPLAAYTFYNVQANHTIAATFVLRTYTITASAGAGGSINPTGAVGVNCGADRGFTITPDPCYDILNIAVDGVPQGPLAAYTFYNVQANHTIAATFVLRTYTITASAGAGGSINPTGAVGVNCGADQSFTITPDPCYDILDVSVDGVPQGPMAAYTFLNVQANHTIAASFVLRTYTITASAGAGGSINPTGAVGVNCGADQGFTITPDPCYDILDVSVDGVPQGPLAAYTFLNVQANHTIAATFVLRTYTITASAGAGGSIDPTGAVGVNCGADQGFTITPDPCYDILDVAVDGVPQGPMAAYTFLNVQANHTIAATFVLRTYTITASAGAGGSINPTGAVGVNCGADQGFTITPDPCYDILDVAVDGVPQGPMAAYTFLNVQANHTIAATFVLRTYTITASAGPGGSINPTGAVGVNCGADQGFTITPDPCYDILDVAVDGVPQGPMAAYTFLNVQANHTIAATFVLRTYTITASAGAGGSINPTGAVGVNCGADQGFTITPDPCYDILDVAVDGVPQGPQAAYTFLNVQANHTIAATFVIKTYALATSVVGGGSLTIVPDLPTYACGASVEISALAGAGWQFDHWTGSATGSDNPLTVIMSGDKSITAVFVDIAPPSVTLTSPNGGEVWNFGESQSITWIATDNVGVTAIDLAYSTDGGATYPNVIGTGLANTGSYLWAVPNLNTTTARVRVTAHDAAGLTNADGSDANFEIVSPAEAVADVVLGPGEVLGVYPNPAFAGTAHILFRIPPTTAIDVSIYDVTGKLVKKIATGAFSGGVRMANWDGRDESGKPASAGIYLVRLVGGPGVHETKRLVLFR